MNLKDVKERTLHEMGAFFNQTDFDLSIHFSTYDAVFFSEYRLSPTECFSVGFHRRKGNSQIQVFLLNRCIKSLKKNSEALRNGASDEKQFNPVVFTIDLSRKKHWFRIHPDHGHFIDGSLLKGHFLKAFLIITETIRKLKDSLEPYSTESVTEEIVAA